MANLILNRLLLDFIDPSQQPTEGSKLSLDAPNIRSLITKLDQQFPGIANKLQSGFTVAIDGEIFSDPWLEPLQESSEVYFLPAIEGG